MHSTKPLIVVVVSVAVVFGFLIPATRAQENGTFQVLHRFSGKDGQSPSAGVIFDAAGNLYGTTTWGGDDSNCLPPTGCGTVFQITPDANGKWTEKVLHAFNYQDGSAAYAGVIFDAAGNLYGTTNYPWGNVFKLTPDTNGKWSETVLHNFPARGPDNPYAGMILDAAGNLYGTTFAGGNGKGKCRDGGCGTVFKLAVRANGKWPETTLHGFTMTDGAFPITGLIWDARGNLYGTTSSGGHYTQGGTVFKLSPGADGEWTESVLHSFRHSGDGTYPNAVVLDAAGNLYGTTYDGGSYADCDYGCGVVFKLMPSVSGRWTEKILLTFHGGKEGWWPYGGVIFDEAGNLYGTTTYGGAYGHGTIFRLTPHPNGNWTETVLHSFNGKDGSEPSGALVFDAAGNLYGTTFVGGNFSGCSNTSGCGVVFKLTP
jgi:uncharacterized repeat protein (TIGR03803 family)